MYHSGDAVIFQMPKVSSRPGPRAKDIDPEPRGEHYTYVVEKFWVVTEVREDNTVCLRTRRGKEHILPVNDPRLRPARWWERILFGSRFPHLPR